MVSFCSFYLCIILLSVCLPYLQVSPSFYTSNGFHSTLNRLHYAHTQCTRYICSDRPRGTIDCPLPVGSASILQKKKRAMAAQSPRLAPCRTAHEQGCIASKVSSVHVCLVLDTELKSPARLELAPHRVILACL